MCDCEGNTLLPDDATFETSIGNWLPTTGLNLARVTTPTPHAGTGDLEVEYPTAIDGDARLVAPSPAPYATQPGQEVTFAAWVRFDPANDLHAGEDPDVNPVLYYGAVLTLTVSTTGGSTVTEEFSNGGDLTEITSSGWTQVCVTATVDAAGQRPLLQIQFARKRTFGTDTSPAAGDVFYVSDVCWNGFGKRGGWSVGSVRIA